MRTLVLLPKLMQIYARCTGSHIYLTSDMRRGYNHIEVFTVPIKSTFVTPMGKYELIHVPLGLAQVPAYFQRLINEVLTGLDFAFGYLNGILGL